MPLLKPKIGDSIKALWKPSNKHISVYILEKIPYKPQYWVRWERQSLKAIATRDIEGNWAIDEKTATSVM